MFLIQLFANFVIILLVVGMSVRTLYVTDLDGTLLNSESRISQESARLLNILAEKGALVTFATARTPATVVDIFENVHINVPGIVMTGAAIYNIATGDYLHKRFLKPEVIIKANAILKTYRINPFVYCWQPNNMLFAYHSIEMTPQEQIFYSQRRDMKLKRFLLDSAPTVDDMKHTLLMFSAGERTQLESLIPLLSKEIGYEVTYYNDIFSDGNGYLEIFAEGVSKSNAIMELKKMFNIDRVVAFGDNLNDISMFEIADYAIATDNAYPAVKVTANEVIGDNNSDSVAKFIYRDFMSNQ